MSQKRRRSRQRAVQALYQWQVTGQDLSDIERQFLDERDMGNVDLAFFHEMLHGVPRHLDDIDAAVGPLLDRSLNQVDPVERAILRLGTFELMFSPDVPYRVVINEAVELAKTYGAEQGHKYVNSVLDKVAHSLRKREIRS